MTKTIALQLTQLHRTECGLAETAKAALSRSCESALCRIWKNTALDTAEMEKWRVPILAAKMGGNNSEAKQAALLADIRRGLACLV